MPEQVKILVNAAAELLVAAQRDWETADPEAVTFKGVPQKGWREAYFEGCKDMATKILALTGATKEQCADAYNNALSVLPPIESN